MPAEEQFSDQPNQQTQANRTALIDGVIFTDGTHAVAETQCGKCKELVAAGDAYLIRVERIEGAHTIRRDELWCFWCLEDHFWEERRIILKRYFGSLYYR